MKGTLIHSWQQCKSVQLLWKTIWVFFKRLIQVPVSHQGDGILKYILNIQSSNSTRKDLSKRNDNLHSHNNLYANIYSGFLIAIQNWKQTAKCPSTPEQINTVSYIHTMEYYSETKRNKVLKHTTYVNFKGIMLTERCQTQKTILYDSIHMTFQKRPDIWGRTDQKRVAHGNFAGDGYT